MLNATDYLLPTEICAMVNVVIDAKNQSLKLCAVDGVDVVRKVRQCLISYEIWFNIGKTQYYQMLALKVITCPFYDICANILQEKAKQDAKEKKVKFRDSSHFRTLIF